MRTLESRKKWRKRVFEPEFLQLGNKLQAHTIISCNGLMAWIKLRCTENTLRTFVPTWFYWWEFNAEFAENTISFSCPPSVLTHTHLGHRYWSTWIQKYWQNNKNGVKFWSRFTQVAIFTAKEFLNKIWFFKEVKYFSFRIFLFSVSYVDILSHQSLENYSQSIIISFEKVDKLKSCA